MSRLVLASVPHPEVQGKRPQRTRRLGRSVLLAVFLPASCVAVGESVEPDLNHSRFTPATLQGHVLHQSEVLGLPWRLVPADGHLLVLDLATDSVLHLLDARSGGHVRSFGRRGEGPGEFSGVWSIDAAPSLPGEVWVYDLSLRRLTRVELEGEGEPRATDFVLLQAETAVLDPIWADTLFVTLGFFQEGRLGHFDAGGRFLRAIGDLPPTDRLVPPQVLQHAYQSSLAADPLRTRFAVAGRHADLLEIFSRDGTLLARAEPPFGFLPRFSVGERASGFRMETGSDLRFAYLDIAATDEHVYALFSGRTRRGFPGAANQGEYLHVYAWDGVLVSVYRLDQPVLAIAIDPAGGELYAVRHDPVPAVLRYRIPLDD